MEGSSTSDSQKTDFPPELVGAVRSFQNTLDDLNKRLDVYHSVPLSELHEVKNLSTLEKAKLDCTSAFALNSLVWMWLRTSGENPKETGVKAELDRVKHSMVKLKDIQDKFKRKPLDAEAAKRMVKSSLWEPKDQRSDPRNRTLAKRGANSGGYNRRNKRGRM